MSESTASPQVTLSPEQEVLLKAKQAQDEFAVIQRKKCDDCAAEIDAVLEKFGCEATITHTIKIVPRQPR